MCVWGGGGGGDVSMYVCVCVCNIKDDIQCVCPYTNITRGECGVHTTIEVCVCAVHLTIEVCVGYPNNS